MTRRTQPSPAPTQASNPFVPEAGSEPVPGYRLLRLRGRGGFATVWESTAPDNSRVALKFMSSHNSQSTARELRSLQAIHRISHPNLLRTRQVWSMSGQIVIAMDLAEASLLDLLLVYAEEFGQPVPVEKVLLYLYQTAEALDFLNAHTHEHEGRTVGFQHGDIKPNNILLTGDKAFLADYGLATPMLVSSAPCPRQGTMEYAAPEIFQGVLSDTADQFSLGVTYYLLRTGTFPFPPPPKTTTKQYVRPLPDLTALPEEERAIVNRALSPVPQNRFPSCREFINLLLRQTGLEYVNEMGQGAKIRPAARAMLVNVSRR